MGRAGTATEADARAVEAGRAPAWGRPALGL